ncbi:MAG TPA: hypothetical protein VHQ02_01400 [Usitatibacter sp.]|jgi:hypothetical protein|nr:hypothetical protein [Usitatibacter sp.]
MRAILAVLAMVVAAGAAAAERTYAVMSLVGDGLLVVTHRAATGSSLSPQTRTFMTLADPALDRAALLAVDTAVKRADPGAKVILLGGRDPAALEAQSRGLGTADAAQAVADALTRRLPATGATHLVLVLKARAPGRFQVDEATADTGALEGLGYYVDSTLITHREAEFALATRGFLAPFAYVDLALVDLATGKVVARREAREAAPRAATQSDSVDAWDAMPPEEKIRGLQELLRKEADTAVPALLARP